MLQLYPDFRVGGKPKFILASEPPKLMFIPDEVRKSVVYVGYNLPTGELSLQGTAFIVQRNIEGTGYAFRYLITAKHILQGIKSKENFDGKIYLRINFTDGNAYSVETDISEWLPHPIESEVDIAVLPNINPTIEIEGNKFDIKSIPIGMFLNTDLRNSLNINIGDDVFLTGLFYNHHGRAKNIPIIRVGNIAAMPEETVHSGTGFIDAYLIEARSIGGLSGSPVFVHLGDFTKATKNGGAILANNRFFLLGVMQGHFEIKPTSDAVVDKDILAKEKINMGIAIVVPIEKVLEVINQPMIRDKEIVIETELRDEMAGTLDSIDEGITITQESFEDALKGASRKISLPDEEKK